MSLPWHSVAAMVDPLEPLSTILAEHGPLDEDEIKRRLRAAGVADPDAVVYDALHMMNSPAGQLTDDRWVWLPTLLDGRVFTHRLAAPEVAHNMLTVTPDLGALTDLFEHEPYHRFADGAPATVLMVDYDDELLEDRGIPEDVVPEGGVLLLPAGALRASDAAEGDLVGIRLSPQGLIVERVTVTADTNVGAQLAATLDADKPVDAGAAVWTVCVQDPTLFTSPLPPVSEIVDDYGMVRDRHLLAPAGFDFGPWRFKLDCELLATRYELDRTDAIAVHALAAACEQLSDLVEDAGAIDVQAAEDGELLAEFGAFLADPFLADVFLAETVRSGRVSALALRLFAESLEPMVPRQARVAFRWLRGVALERIGDIAGAERELLAAESMDTDWPLPLFELARFASDRSDAERGLALLRRAGAAADHPLLELLERYRAEPRTDLGRNEPCWCGSGRKYKKCHLGNEQLPLPERAAWLYAKAAEHVELSDWNELRIEVAFERSRYDDDPGALTDALADPLVMDAVLSEGGAFEDFLDIRGSLLPADERLLADQWSLSERSVFEVEQAKPGEGVTVRDVRTGDVHEVRERAASRQLKPGLLVCTRVLPAGDTAQFFGGLEVIPLHLRDPLVELLDSEPDAEELVAFLTARFAPPTLVNTEGDPMAICEATVRVSDPAAVEAGLDDTYRRLDGDGPPRWHEYVTTHGMQRVRGTFALEGDELRVETNSEKRMDSALSTLERLDPGVEILDDTRQPVGDVRDLSDRFPGDDADELDPDDPEVAAALDAFVREYEANWLDQPIPALNGCTPRQAADDPTRRGDLIKLLDSFPAGVRARGAMDVDRLRAALGLG